MARASDKKGAAKAAPTLDQLAEQIRRETEVDDKMDEQALARAIRVGGLFRQAKNKVPHGGWNSWLKANYSGDVSTARIWMQLADPSNRERVRDLKSMREALRAIRKPRKPADTPAKRKPRESGKRLRALHAQKRKTDSTLLIARIDIVKMVGILEAVDLPALGFGDADEETIKEIHDELEILFGWLDRTLTVVTAELSDQQRREKIRRLREDTEGRTAEEVATARRLADKLERKQLVAV